MIVSTTPPTTNPPTIQGRSLLWLLCLPLLLTSCLSYKQIVNFQDGSDLGKGLADSIANLQQIRLQADDVVFINITSYNMEEAGRFNGVIGGMQMGMMQGGGGSVNEPIFGYRITQQGDIEMPILGRFRVQGLTLDQLHDLVLEKVNATGYLKNPAVQIRYLNFRVTILGEVNGPGTFTITTPKINILEALGMARDLTLFSNRDNILVIREQNGKRNYGRIDVTSRRLFESPYYYLQPNDVVYVEPHRSKILAAPDPASRYVGALLGIGTLVTFILTIFR